MLPTNNSYSSTSNPHAPSEPSPSMGTRRSTSGGRRDPPLRNATGGCPPRSHPVPGHHRRPPHLSSPPAPGTGGPAANAAALLFLPPALSLVHPTLYLPASILALLTPARNFASLPAPPRLPPTATTTPTTGAASTPRPIAGGQQAAGHPVLVVVVPTAHKEGGGRGAEHCALSSRDHTAALSGGIWSFCSVLFWTCHPEQHKQNVNHVPCKWHQLTWRNRRLPS
jgi:hypothetical protein